MSTRSYLAGVLILFLLACQVPTPALDSTPTHSRQRTATVSATPLSPSATPAEKPCCEVRLHPEEALYVGDKVSFEVIAPSAEPYLNQPLTATLVSPPNLIGSTTFQPYGFDRRPQATLLWAWDTNSLLPGNYTIHFSIPPLQEEWKQTVTLLPRSALPAQEQNAQWQTLTTNCCKVHFITNTAAHRDIEEITETVEQEFQTVQEQIPITPERQLDVVLIPRVIGNGGFANEEINVSYLDRNYTANDFATILHHEMVHGFDQFAQEGERPSLFVEGIAVYLSGGHYFPEPLLPRAAELVHQKKYLSLEKLATDFYNAQHELAYLEAGALVEYLSHRWGWQTVWELYLEMTMRKGETQQQAIERALTGKLGLSLKQLEDEFRTTLEKFEKNSQFYWDIVTIDLYYETLRTYQQRIDPAAYYRTAWMLDAHQMRQQGIVADYLRHPRQAENLALELLLNEAGRARRTNEYARFWSLYEAIIAFLDKVPIKDTTSYFGNHLATDAWQVVQILLANGYEPHVWELGEGQAKVWVRRETPNLKPVILEKQEGKWQIISGTSASADDLIQRTK